MHNINSPASHDEGIEHRLAKSPAPRVSLADLEHNILSANYFTAMQGVHGAAGCPGIVSAVPTKSPLDLLTICVLVLRNGFTVVGTSACASPANFDAQIGRELAFADAKRQMWPLMGFHLKQQLHTGDDYK